LLFDGSNEAHPGHVPGGFVGPGPEFDDMIFDGDAWHMNPHAGDSQALALLSAEDLHLATVFEREGGLALCLSSAFKMADDLRALARELLAKTRHGEASTDDESSRPSPLESDSGWQHVVDAVAATGKTLEEQAKMLFDVADLSEDREALQRNVWSSIDFFRGEETNAELVQRLEAQFAGQLVRCAQEDAWDAKAGCRVARAEGKDDQESKEGKEGGEDRDAGNPSETDEDGIFDVALRSSTDVLAGTRMLPESDRTAALSRPRNLGTALDLVGVYLKNYEIHKAHRVLDRIGPLCRKRGGAWLMKALDKTCAVRMKQHRAHDALLALQELETLVPFHPEEGWQYYDVLYRNFSWVYAALDEAELALKYSCKAVEVKKASGVMASWFDCWDLSKAHARLGQKAGRRDEMETGYELCCKAASIHRVAEPKDLISLSKILSNVGEICMGIGDSYWLDHMKEQAFVWFSKAEEPLTEAYNIYRDTLGTNKPLFGWQAGIMAHCMVRLERWNEARKYIEEAIKVECSKDIATPGSILALVERVVTIHQKAKDLKGLASYWDCLDHGLERLRRRGADVRERKVFALLLQTIATMTLVADAGEANLLNHALMLLESAQTYALAAIEEGDQRVKENGWDEPQGLDEERTDEELLEAETKKPQVSGDDDRDRDCSMSIEPKDFNREVDTQQLLDQITCSIRVLEIGRRALAGEMDPEPFRASLDEGNAPLAVD